MQQARRFQGLSQEQVASRIFEDRSRLAQWETGHRAIPVLGLREYAEALKVVFKGVALRRIPRRLGMFCCAEEGQDVTVEDAETGEVLLTVAAPVQGDIEDFARTP